MTDIKNAVAAAITSFETIGQLPETVLIKEELVERSFNNAVAAMAYVLIETAIEAFDSKPDHFLDHIDLNDVTAFKTKRGWMFDHHRFEFYINHGADGNLEQEDFSYEGLFTTSCSSDTPKAEVLAKIKKMYNAILPN